MSIPTQSRASRSTKTLAVARGKAESQARPHAREALLDAAEQLFGQRGIEGASLREIAAAAGQRNTAAVSYHFGDKQALADALIADRLGKIEALRQALIDASADIESCNIETLLKFMWQPMLDLCEGRGGNWLIQFHLSYHVQNAGRSHPILSDPDIFPASNLLVGRLRSRCQHLPLEQFRYRMGLIFVMFWVAVARHDNAAISTNQSWSTRFSLDETIKVAVAALMASP